MRREVMALCLGLVSSNVVQAGMSIDDYRALRGREEGDIYIIGVLQGFTWANKYLDDRKDDALYCVPPQRGLNSAIAKDLVDSWLRTYPIKGDVQFEAVLLGALLEAFPCTR